MAVTGNTPSASRLSFNGLNYLTSSDLIEMHAKAKMAIDPKVFGRYGAEKLGIMPFIEEFGQKEAVTSSEFGHYEQDFTRDIVTFSAVTAGDGTAELTLTISPAYNYDYPANQDQTWYADTYTNIDEKTNILREGDTLMIGAKEVQVLSVTYSTGSAVVRTTQAGETLTFATDVSGVECFISGRAREERSTGPDGKDARLIQYRNYIQTIDEAYKVSGAALGQGSVVSGFGGTDKWYATGIFNTRTNFDALCELTLLTGKKISNTGFGNTFKTEGIIPFIENYGNVQNHGGTINLTLLDDMIADLKKYYGSDEYLLLESHPFNVALDNSLRGTVDNGGVVFDQKLLDLGFGAVRRSGINIYRKSLQAFSDPRSLGSADSIYSQMALMIPTGTATAFDYNGGQRVEKPTMVLRYLDVDGEDMGYKEWFTGGAGIASTNNVDEMVITMRKRIGLELYGANLFGLFKFA